MSFAKKTISGLHLSKSEELSYQLSEVDYHKKCSQDSLNECFHHLKMASYHYELAKAASEELYE